MRYRLNQPDVIHETVDGEVLVVHTPSGTYYSLLGSGTLIWEGLVAGLSVAEVAESFAADGAAGQADVRAAVERFARDLVDADLLVPDDRAAGPASPPTERRPFSPPEMQAFTDMQELLLVDPIHEVDPAAGWPLPRNAG